MFHDRICGARRAHARLTGRSPSLETGDSLGPISISRRPKSFF